MHSVYATIMIQVSIRQLVIRHTALGGLRFALITGTYTGPARIGSATFAVPIIIFFSDNIFTLIPCLVSYL
ncbi:hypothetical protein F4680DRAFT_431026 [Xylaria scruposa]|nr:hypothetical protein F4680DRAFT_431026 [Xylaria scruposa]